MKTVFTHGGKNHWKPTADALIELRQSDDENGLFKLTYGCEVKVGLTYAQACKALGEAMMHNLGCEGAINTEGR